MSDNQLTPERELLDKVLFDWIISLGKDAIAFDYSEINELLDGIEGSES